ncbi:bifunctional tetrahydrofolate synthase/dihydrofolate synthase [uncultured Legionella sp.]|uniref:bifunctional tetrahydrofolate synthase/dihydrofolate synthase n=1 Tax=uncultured Legionella sp. TaxID=210934 RepID=UPI00262DC3F1|nr:bifunctional tetrahydrofolate synthase/dihydrofolate synthase [uncultured Legionella sp.]
MLKSLNEWDLHDWLVNLESRHTQEIQLGLERILEVAKKLNVLNPDCKIVTVAGTNGKGSTVTALEAIYHTAGYRTGSYTSPHLIHFNERIRVNLKSISDANLCHAFSIVESTRGETNLTYFEMATLAALVYFKHQNLDVLILEVGLGGRLDATNIIDADLSIITTIDYDHQDFLGTTLEAIGFEKAGILRQDKPFIYADENPPESILDVASNLSSAVYSYSNDFFFAAHHNSWDFIFQGESLCGLPIPRIQLKSAAAAILASRLLADDLPVPEKDYFKAMERIFIPGRLQLQKGNVNILYDVSHNPQSAKLLAAAIKQMNVTGRVHAVFSVLKDKDILGLIFPLKDCVERWYPAQLDNKRAASSELILTSFKDAELFVDVCYTSPLVAFEQARAVAVAGDLIIVYGSFFTVSHVMAAQQHIFEQKEIQ